MYDLSGNNTSQQKQQGVCEECKSITFTETFLLRKVSRILTGQPKDTYVPIPLFMCTSCGHVNDEFYPNELKLEQKPAAALIS